MKIGFIGLGKMGSLMVERLVQQGVDVVVYNRSSDKIKLLKVKTIPCASLAELIDNLTAPRVIFLMVKAEAVDEVLDNLMPYLIKGDIVIDGGNSFYQDSQRRFKELRQKGIHFLDAGCSGGLEGAKNGLSLMVGGEQPIFTKIKPLFEILTLPSGSFAYFGPAGAGHFIKMVHNGVEYGMMQSLGEGFSLLAASREYALDLVKVAKTWEKGSIVRSYLVELLGRALDSDHRLTKITGIAGGGQTGELMVRTAKMQGIKVPIIELSVKERKKTLKKPNFTGKVVAVLRKEFGGHSTGR